MHRRHAIVEEAVVAAIGLVMSGAFIAGVFWLATGRSPWPGLVLAETAALGWGLLLVVGTSPSWNR